MLETKRLILRKWTEADAESLFQYASNTEIGPVPLLGEVRVEYINVMTKEHWEGV